MSNTKKLIKSLSNTPFTGQIDELKNIMEVLRDKEYGCPWDLEQDHLSIRQYLIEETYEAIEAIEKDETKDIVNELGDVLLQIVFHAQMGKEKGTFTFEDIVKSVSEKMLRRHPHVFGDIEAKDSSQVLKNWEKIKQTENQTKPEEENLFSNTLKKLPSSLPSLLQAERIGARSSRVNFDWNNINDVLKKVEEEWNEVKSAFNLTFNGAIDVTKPLTNNIEITDINKISLQNLGKEIGDNIFSLTQLARWLNLSAENLTRECCARFIERIETIENNFSKDLNDLNDEEKSIAWEKAKLILKKKDPTSS